MSELFVPFNRLGADASSIEGSGLGLSLSQVLATAMGGSLTLETSSTEGSTFLLEVPIAAPTTLESRGDRTRRTVAASDLEAHPKPEEDHVILYIEDNLANVDLVNDMLATRPNLSLVSTIQGSIGIELARTKSPSLVLLDLHLPDMHGQEVLHRLKHDAATTAIPVVMLTADAISAIPADYVALGARNFLTKPIDVRFLMQEIDAILVEVEATR